MAIMRTNDWKKLVSLCKDEIKNTKGDKRAARGLLYRLTFYIAENRLIHPQRRKQEPPIQSVLFQDKGTPLSPKEVLDVPPNDLRLPGPPKSPAKKNGTKEFDPGQAVDGEGSQTSIAGDDKKEKQISEQGGQDRWDQVFFGERGEEIPRITDEGKGWPDLEP